MNLRRIRLQRVPGIEPPFEVDGLSPKINVIVGPNGSGKTSLRRAVTATLWPKSDLSRQLEVDSDWQDGERRLHASRESGRVSWRENASAVDAPAVPDLHLASCYTLGVKDLLLSDNETDQTIADDVRLAMSGGYDLRGVIKGQFSPRAQIGRREVKALGEARSAYRVAQTAQRDLVGEEKRLAELRVEETAAKEAQRALAKLDDALELHAVRNELEAVSARLLQFPQTIERVAATDGTLLDRLESARRDAEERIKEIRGKIALAERGIRQAGFGEKAPAAEELDAIDGWMERIEALEDRLTDIDRDRARATAKAEEARGRLAGSVDVGAPSPPALPTLEKVEKFVLRRDRSRLHHEEIRQRLGLLGAAETREGMDDLEAGEKLLREWLATPAAGTQPNRSPLILGAIAVAVLGAALAFLHHLAWLLLAGGGAGVALALFGASLGAGGGGADRRRLEERFRELGIGAPSAWTPEHVRALLREVDRRLASARYGAEVTKERERLLAQSDAAEKERSDLEKEGSKLRAALGVDACGDLALHEIARACIAYAEAEAELIGVEASATSCRTEREDVAKKLLAAFAKFSPAGSRAAADTTELRAKLKDLQRRAQDFRTASAKLDEATTELETEERRLSASKVDMEKFYADRALEPGDRSRLDGLLEQFGEYEKQRSERDRLRKRVEDLEVKLREHSELLGEDMGRLETRRSDAEAKSDALTEISQEIGRIEQKIGEAQAGTSIAQALEKLGTTRDALADAIEEAQFAAAGRFLVEQVDDEHEKESRPAVLSRAMQYFAAFTHNAYELLLSDGPGSGFCARDTSRDLVVGLSELSDGTRIQLLLAVRLAFATSGEIESRIPLMLDEALSTSDPDRFVAVAESLGILAAEGRQIFYLTANPADVAAWRAATEGKPSLDLNVVDLGQIRGRQAAVATADELVLPTRRRVPKPDGMTAEQYGAALSVPRALTHQPIESLHLFYVLRRELPLLHRLLDETRIDTIGRWESFERSGRASLFLPADLCRRLSAFCACARTVHAAAAIGRGRPVDDGALQDSGAVSERYLDALRQITHETGCEARRLIEFVRDSGDDRVKGFRKDKLADLQEFFRENGYLDERPTLVHAEIVARALESLHASIEDGLLQRATALGLVEDLLAAFGFTD